MTHPTLRAPPMRPAPASNPVCRASGNERSTSGKLRRKDLVRAATPRSNSADRFDCHKVLLRLCWRSRLGHVAILRDAIPEIGLTIAAHAYRSRALVGINKIGIVQAAPRGLRAWRGGEAEDAGGYHPGGRQHSDRSKGLQRRSVRELKSRHQAYPFGLLLCHRQ